ncbi:hypothetical protein ACFY4I_12280 [Streptomyces scabiei]
MGVTLRAAFDAWASRWELEGHADLAEVRRTSCARLRDVIAD